MLQEPELETGLAAGGLLRRSQNDGSWSFHDARTNRLRCHGLQGWRTHLAGHLLDGNPSTREQGPFQEIFLHRPIAGPRLLQDSVMLLDGLVNREECATLISAADCWCRNHDDSSASALRRIQCHPDGINLDGRAHALAHIILTRVLWCVEHLEPALAKKIFPGASKFEHLADMCVKLAWGEPYVNRYTEGGCFEPHVDGHALTILVPLSTPDTDFSGGGTAFWSSHIATDNESAKSVPPSLVLAPSCGTGILWRGHITHAGLAVKEGIRHVFVASFDLKVRGPPA